MEILYHSCELCGVLGVEQTGQLVQVAIELLDPRHELPNWDSIGLLQPIADVESLGLGRSCPGKL